MLMLTASILVIRKHKTSKISVEVKEKKQRCNLRGVRRRKRATTLFSIHIHHTASLLSFRLNEIYSFSPVIVSQTASHMIWQQGEEPRDKESCYMCETEKVTSYIRTDRKI